MARRRAFRFPRRTAVQVAADVDEELAFHLDRVAAELVDEGWLADAARVEARRRFGDLEGTRKYCCAVDASKERQMKWIERLAELGQDLRFAGRQLGRSPIFTLVAVLTLALGIGATTAIFSIVNGVLLRPLPFQAPERLVRPYFVSPGGQTHGAFSPPNFLDVRAASRTLTDLTSLEGGTLNLSGDGSEPERLRAALVGANFFKVMGIQPLRGRTFAPGDDRPGAPRVAVISEPLWERRFGSDPGLVGRSLTLDGQPYLVVGILRKWAQFPSGSDVWVPKVFSPEELNQRGSVFFAAIGRLKPGATLRQARTEADVIGHRLSTQYPKDNAIAASMSRSRFYMLLLGGFAAIALVLAAVGIYGVIAYAVRQRTQEIGIRMALGASRDGVMRMVVGQGGLALTGAAAGLLGAFAAARGLRGLLFEVSASDPATYAGVAGVLVAVAAVASYLPARRAARTEPNLALRGEG